jgi:hypothetical protein
VEPRKAAASLAGPGGAVGSSRGSDEEAPGRRRRPAHQRGEGREGGGGWHRCSCAWLRAARPGPAPLVVGLEGVGARGGGLCFSQNTGDENRTMRQLQACSSRRGNGLDLEAQVQ